MYRIAFAGLGSIAKRHVKNVGAYLESRGDAYFIDLYRSALGRDIPSDLAPLISILEYIQTAPNCLTLNSITPNRYAFRSTIAA